MVSEVDGLGSPAPQRSERGSALFPVCPKRGYIRLKSHAGVVAYYETCCKSWRCSSCQKKVKALVVDRIEYGANLIPGPLWFITLTFQTGFSKLRDARSVERAYRAWCALMSRRWPNLSWFKVVEWTKRRQAHLHLIVGGVSTEGVRTCIKDRDRRGKVLRVSCSYPKSCLEHQISSLWLSSTRDSYIVSCGAVVGPRGIAQYMSKYVTKDMYVWDRRGVDGFKRRWSCSRNWPRYEKLELRATADGEGWNEAAWSQYERGYAIAQFYGDTENTDPSFERVGSDRAKEFAEKSRRRRLRTQGRSLIDASNHETRRLAGGNSGH